MGTSESRVDSDVFRIQIQSSDSVTPEPNEEQREKVWREEKGEAVELICNRVGERQ